MLFCRAIIKRDLVANEEYSNIDDVYPHKRFASGDEEPINASLNDNNSVKIIEECRRSTSGKRKFSRTDLGIFLMINKTELESDSGVDCRIR